MTECHFIVINVVINLCLCLRIVASADPMHQSRSLDRYTVLWRVLSGLFRKLDRLVDSIQDAYLGLDMTHGSIRGFQGLLHYIDSEFLRIGRNGIGFSTPIAVAIATATLDSAALWISAVGRAVEVSCFPRPSVSRSGDNQRLTTLLGRKNCWERFLDSQESD